MEYDDEKIPAPPPLRRGMALGNSMFYWMNFCAGAMDFERIRHEFYGPSVSSSLIDSMGECGWELVRSRRLIKRVVRMAEKNFIRKKRRQLAMTLELELNFQRDMSAAVAEYVM